MLLVEWKAFLVDAGLILLSVVLGSMIGFEREAQGKSAGLRTHVLVCVGATLMSIISMKGFGAWEDGLRDPGRMIGYLVAGIGFLGAGTILRDGLSIKGLTTAASLWATCMVGITVGSGLVLYAIFTTVIIVIILSQFSKIERSVAVKASSMLKISAVDRPGLLGDIAALFGRHAISIKKSDINTDLKTGLVTIEFELEKVSKDKRVCDIAFELNDINGICKYEVKE